MGELPLLVMRQPGRRSGRWQSTPRPDFPWNRTPGQRRNAMNDLDQYTTPQDPCQWIPPRQTGPLSSRHCEGVQRLKQSPTQQRELVSAQNDGPRSDPRQTVYRAASSRVEERARLRASSGRIWGCSLLNPATTSHAQPVRLVLLCNLDYNRSIQIALRCASIQGTARPARTV